MLAPLLPSILGEMIVVNLVVAVVFSESKGQRIQTWPEKFMHPKLIYVATKLCTKSCFRVTVRIMNTRPPRPQAFPQVLANLPVRLRFNKRF